MKRISPAEAIYFASLSRGRIEAVLKSEVDRDAEIKMLWEEEQDVIDEEVIKCHRET
jgi:hypothetical protein